MRVYGIDFTSNPKRLKPITCLQAALDGDRLSASNLRLWQSFAEFEAALLEPGPWIAGIDFPFGQSRRFIENAGWPMTWPDYVAHAEGLGRPGFRSALDRYRKDRPLGDKEHRRATDVAAGSISPQKLYGVPVGLMFYEGAPRLLDSGVTVAGLLEGDPSRIVVEAYPGVMARSIIGRQSYKNDRKKKQTDEQRRARRDLLQQIRGSTGRERYGITIDAPDELADDPGADHLDALLCAVQAAWAWRNRKNNFGLPAAIDPLEGWIADPHLQA